MSTRLPGIGMTSARTRERLLQRLRDSGIHDETVLAALHKVPRHLFVDEALASRAYEDTALPIGQNQTISQPYIVARMTEQLFANGARRVLEIGTGCGYQTAILCELAAEVYSVERLTPLHQGARRMLQELGYRNFRLKLGDGGLGWADYAPYDGILVAAAASDVPMTLLGQLAPGGRLVIPVGTPARQELLSIHLTDEGYIRERLEAVNFVPLIRDEDRV